MSYGYCTFEAWCRTLSRRALTRLTSRGRRTGRCSRAWAENSAPIVVTEADVQDAMDRVLALDAAYPPSLLPGMLEKFPNTVELFGGGLTSAPIKN